MRICVQLATGRRGKVKRVCNAKRQFTQQFTGEVSIKIVLAVRYGDEGAENWETSMELSRLKRTT